MNFRSKSYRANYQQEASRGGRRSEPAFLVLDGGLDFQSSLGRDWVQLVRRLRMLSDLRHQLFLRLGTGLEAAVHADVLAGKFFGHSNRQPASRGGIYVCSKLRTVPRRRVGKSAKYAPASLFLPGSSGSWTTGSPGNRKARQNEEASAGQGFEPGIWSWTLDELLQARHSLRGRFTPRDASGTARSARFAPPSLPLRSSFAFTPPRRGALAHPVRSGGVGWCRLAREEGENWALIGKRGREQVAYPLKEESTGLFRGAKYLAADPEPPI